MPTSKVAQIAGTTQATLNLAAKDHAACTQCLGVMHNRVADCQIYFLGFVTKKLYK